MGTIINIPANFTTSTTAVMYQIFTDLSAPIILIIGVLVATIVVEIIIGALRHR
jgi:hypothetical protein